MKKRSKKMKMLHQPTTLLFVNICTETRFVNLKHNNQIYIICLSTLFPIRLVDLCRGLVNLVILKGLLQCMICRSAVNCKILKRFGIMYDFVVV